MGEETVNSTKGRNATVCNALDRVCPEAGLPRPLPPLPHLHRPLRRARVPRPGVRGHRGGDHPDDDDDDDDNNNDDGR